MNLIEYRQIHKAFDKPVLTGVDLEVRPGEMFAIFGPSGVGKSVLLKTTIGLVRPDRGEVFFEGEPIYRRGARAMAAVRKEVGYVFQHAALFDSMNVFDNVCMGIPENELGGLSRIEQGRRVWRALDLVNLDPREVLSATPAELSGGMKKRVGIARAIVGTPRVLLWDEPTTGLDPINTAAVERLITDLSNRIEVTSVVVTHDIFGGLEICDRVAILYDGVTRYIGEPAGFWSSEDPVIRAFLDRAAAGAAADMEVT